MSLRFLDQTQMIGNPPPRRPQGTGPCELPRGACPVPGEVQYDAERLVKTRMIGRERHLLFEHPARVRIIGPWGRCFRFVSVSSAYSKSKPARTNVAATNNS